MQNNKSSSYVFSDSILEGINKGIRKKYLIYSNKCLLIKFLIVFLYQKDIFDNGFYDEKMLLGYEDWEFNVRLAVNKYYGKRLSKPFFTIMFQIQEC